LRSVVGEVGFAVAIQKYPGYAAAATKGVGGCDAMADFDGKQ
jgi:hypothetical protein